MYEEVPLSGVEALPIHSVNDPDEPFVYVPSDHLTGDQSNPLLREKLPYEDDLLVLAAKVAYVHFPANFVGANSLSGALEQYPVIDRYGNPVPIADTQAYKNKLQSRSIKNGGLQIGSPDGETVPVKDAVRYAPSIRAAKDRIARRLPDLVDTMIEAAQGVRVIRYDKDGNEIGVYTQPPDIGAIKNLLDRVMGRPTETKEIEHTGTVNTKVRIFIPSNGRETEDTAQPSLRALPGGSEDAIDGQFVPLESAPTSITHQRTTAPDPFFFPSNNEVGAREDAR